ncbi:hypothetical protein DVB37_25000 [Achromobacter sp. B7]|nr:hypothetical protein DVB37_25000 [Achromobacter sp. B7]
MAPLSPDHQSVMTPIDRINLRLATQTFQIIDMARSKRPGNVSRNTWIAEAIQEKLARDLSSAPELTTRAPNA